MRDHTYTQFFIISAYVADNTKPANNILTGLLEDDLKHSGKRFEQITGVYKGSVETSFIVYTSDYDLGKELSKRYNQECILIRNGHNDCVLWYNDHKQQYIGQFKQVEEARAIKEDGYSLINNLYYIVTDKRAVRSSYTDAPVSTKKAIRASYTDATVSTKKAIRASYTDATI